MAIGAALMGLGQFAEFVPGALQAGAGLFQFPFELGSEILNQRRRERGGQRVSEIGKEHSRVFLENVPGQLQRGQDILSTAGVDIDEILRNASASVGAAGATAEAQFGGIVPDATRMGKEALARYRTAADATLATLPEITSMADEVYAEVKKGYHDLFNRAHDDRAEILRMFEEGNERIASVTERASETSSGIAVANKRSKANFQAQARALMPPMPEAEIEAQLALMDEESRATISNTWSKAAVDTSAQYISHYDNTIATLGSMSNTMSAVLSQSLGTIGQAGALAVGAREYATGVRKDLAREGVSVEMGINNYITGAQEFVASNVSDVIRNTAQIQAMIAEQRGTMRFNTANGLARFQEMMAAAWQQGLDYAYNGAREGVAVALGREFTPPSLTNLMAPANSMLQQGVSDFRTNNASPPSSNDAIWGSLIGAGGNVAGAGIQAHGATQAASILAG